MKPPLGRSGGGRKGRGAALCAQALGLGWIGEVALGEGNEFFSIRTSHEDSYERKLLKLS